MRDFAKIIVFEELCCRLLKVLWAVPQRKFCSEGGVGLPASKFCLTVVHERGSKKRFDGPYVIHGAGHCIRGRSASVGLYLASSDVCVFWLTQFKRRNQHNSVTRFCETFAWT